jgi:hypothetical protein
VKRMLTVLAVALVMAAMFVATAMPAFAKIQPVDVSCTNQGGNQPGGQQPSCQSGGLDQETENQNPSGQAPPGQNP